MKKAKAAMAGIVIAAVLGASAVLWLLNDKGYIGASEDPTGNNSVYEDEAQNKDNGIDADEPANEDGADSPDNTQTGNEEQENQGESNDGAATDPKAVNDFLSIFSKYYFAEASGNYKENSYSDYDVLRFAYLYVRDVYSNSVVTKDTDNQAGQYLGVPYEKAAEFIEETLGFTPEKKSAYTESQYAFIEYDDGYYYAPAADGLSYVNIAVADSITDENGYVNVEFTVYSGGASTDMTGAEAKEQGELYASGTAKLKKDAEGYLLAEYRIEK